MAISRVIKSKFYYPSFTGLLLLCNVNTEFICKMWNVNCLNQRSSTLFLGTHYPKEFSYNPNQTHLKQPIKLLKTA